MPQLLEPKAIAVVGASQRGGRGTNVISNLRNCGYGGEIFAVNPRYTEILGHPCVRSVRELPAAVECIVGMCICGPNCFGLINVKAGIAAYSGPLMRPLRAGPVALVSQSGGLGASVFAPLMTD